MMETIKQQSYDNIVTIVHTDDPRDEYVMGDMILRGAAYSPEFGNGTYNLYNNRLLRAIPDGPGWYHFIDDDDEYAAPDVIERLVAAAKPDHVNVARVERIRAGKPVIYPGKWKKQKSFQTEIFFLHTDHKRKAKWWGNTGGDHHYSKQLTKIMPINWINNIIICRAQESKGCGRRNDAGGAAARYRDFPDSAPVAVLYLQDTKAGLRKNRIQVGEMRNMIYSEARKLENAGMVKITYPNDHPERAPIKHTYII